MNRCRTCKYFKFKKVKPAWPNTDGRCTLDKVSVSSKWVACEKYEPEEKT